MTTDADFQSGDIIAFGGGDDPLDFLIKLFSRSKVTHCGMVIPQSLNVDGKPQTERHIIESTILNGVNGVQINPLAQRIATCGDPRIWNLQLSHAVYEFLDWDAVWSFAMGRAGRDKYNVLELGAYVMRDVPFVQDLPIWYKPNSHEEVCSELVAELLAAGGLPGLRPYETSPQAIAELRIYADCLQVAGKPATIRRFNSQ